jgi:hypothetical protein
MTAETQEERPVENQPPASKPKLTTEEKIARLKVNYRQSLDFYESTNDPLYRQAQQLCERLLGEPNVLGVRRFIELFGFELADQKATEAIILFKRALKGPHKGLPPGTPVGTPEGNLRTCGGVFFFLMSQHARLQGRTIMSLELPWYPFEVSNKPALPKKPKPEKQKESRSEKRKKK